MESLTPTVFFRIYTDALIKHASQIHWRIGAFNYGFNTNYLRRVVSFWRHQFDWEKQVKVINQYHHFKTKIEGKHITLSNVIIYLTR